KKFKYSPLLLLILLGLPPFILSAIDRQEVVIQMNTLPEVVSTITGNIRWGIFLIIVLFFFYRYNSFFPKINKSFLFIVFFYFIQMLYAIGTNSDVIRYVGLTVMALTIP